MRSLWKGLFLDNSIKRLKKSIKTINISKKIWSKRSIIIPEFIGFSFYNHIGNNYKLIKITEDMIGTKFGEYTRTRKRNLNRFIKLKKKKKKK